MGLHDLSDLPFAWDSIDGITATAKAHPGGLIDLSMGTPVDPTPEVVRKALEAASNAPGYPMTAGTHTRVALTSTDAPIADAVTRITQP